MCKDHRPQELPAFSLCHQSLVIDLQQQLISIKDTKSNLHENVRACKSRGELHTNNKRIIKRTRITSEQLTDNFMKFPPKWICYINSFGALQGTNSNIHRFIRKSFQKLHKKIMILLCSMTFWQCKKLPNQINSFYPNINLISL